MAKGAPSKAQWDSSKSQSGGSTADLYNIGKYYWLVTNGPNGSGNVYFVNSSGNTGQIWAGNNDTKYLYGYRPLVCLKSSVQLVKQADGSYNIE